MSAFEVSSALPLQSDFGLPIVIKGENPSAYLRLNAAVRLPQGDIHLAFTNATTRFWLTIGSGSDELTLLDTDVVCHAPRRDGSSVTTVGLCSAPVWMTRCWTP